MKSTGIVRKIDELGRIVLPIELRRTLEIGERDALEIWHDPGFASYRARILTDCPPAGCAGCAKRFERTG